MGAVASDINPISAIAKAVASMCHDCTKFVLNSCESECDCCSCWKFGFHTYKVSDSDSDSSNVPCCDYWRVFFKGGANLTPLLRVMEKWHNFSPRKLWCLRGLSYSDKPWRVFLVNSAAQCRCFLHETSIHVRTTSVILRQSGPIFPDQIYGRATL